MQVTKEMNSMSKPNLLSLISSLGLGVILLSSFSVVNFIAANWPQMTTNSRLVLVQSIFILAIILAVLGAKQSRLLFILLTQFAALATGALLALIGQIYQTPADNWNLFVIWALLITPWLLFFRTVFLVLLWTLLLNLTAFLYLADASTIDMMWQVNVALSLFVLNAFLLIVSVLIKKHLNDKWRLIPKVLFLVSAISLWFWLLGVQAESAASQIIITYLIAASFLVFSYFWFAYKDCDLVLVSFNFITTISILSLLVIQFSDDVTQIIFLALLIFIALSLAVYKLMQLWQLKNPELSQKPWCLHLLKIIGLLIVVSLFLIWLVLALDLDSVAELSSISLVLFVVGIITYKLLRHSIFGDASLVLALAGQFLFTVICLLEHVDEHYYLVLTALLLIGFFAYIFLQNKAIRFLSSALTLFSIVWLFNIHQIIFNGMHEELLASNISYTLLLLLALGLILWRKSIDNRLLQPLSWSLLFVAGSLAFLCDFINHNFIWTWPFANAFSGIVYALLPFVLLLPIIKRLQLKPYIVLLLFIASIGWVGAFTLGFGLALWCLGASAKHRQLQIVGALAALIGLVLYYFQTSTSLIFKAQQAALAAVLILIAVLLLIKSGVDFKKYKPDAKEIKFNILGLVIGSILVFYVSQYQVMSYKNILANGKTVVLELAPVDPRSLMQGDYMRLNYAINQDISNWLNAHTDEFSALKEQGKAWLELAEGEDGVWQLQGISVVPRSNVADAAGIVFVALRWSPSGVDWGARTWFFPEGHGDKYAVAKFAQLKVADDGTALISDLLDAKP